MRKTLVSVLLLLLVLVTPAFAGLVNYSAPSEKEIGEIYAFSVVVQDGGGSPLNNTPCQAHVSYPNGEIFNYFKPDRTTNTLYTDSAGNLVYGFKLVSDLYQADNIYNLTVLCPSGSVMQAFGTLPPRTPNQAFNFMLFLVNNAYFVFGVLLLAVIVKILIDEAIGMKWSNLIFASIIFVLIIAMVLGWLFL